MQNKSEVSSKSLLVAVVLSILVVVLWGFIFPNEKQKSSKSLENYSDISGEKQIASEDIKASQKEMPKKIESEIIKIAKNNMKLAIEVRGLKMNNINNVMWKNEDDIVFAKSLFVQSGFLSQTNSMPNANTVWQVVSQKNGYAKFSTTVKGIAFYSEISIDENSIISNKLTVQNNTSNSISFKTFSRINKTLSQMLTGNVISHEGPIAYSMERLHEKSYKKVKKQKFSFEAKPNEVIWLGLVDKYNIINLFHQNATKINFSHNTNIIGETFQTDSINDVHLLLSGQSYTEVISMFAGQKVLSNLEMLSKKYNIPHFDKAIDFGFLYFITKPIFLLLSWIYHHINSFAIAIVILTLLIKLILLPLTLKSSLSIAKMKALQPYIKKLQEQYKNDKPSLGQATIKLYREKQVNPLAGCLPMLIQIPIFFALYKVLYVSIEMKGQPLFFWITDLSAPDPTSILNLFGLIPFNAPHFLGVLPLAFGVSMFLYQKVSPQPTEKTQAQMMKFLPVIMTIFLSNFASGLLFYWVVNNIFSIAQQLLIEKVILPRHNKKY